jgi:hypothetical protein
MIEKLVRQCKIMTGEHNSNKSILISIEPSQQHLTIDHYLIQEPCRSQSMSVGQGTKSISKSSPVIFSLKLVFEGSLNKTRA